MAENSNSVYCKDFELDQIEYGAVRHLVRGEICLVIAHPKGQDWRDYLLNSNNTSEQPNELGILQKYLPIYLVEQLQRDDHPTATLEGSTFTLSTVLVRVNPERLKRETETPFDCEIVTGVVNANSALKIAWEDVLKGKRLPWFPKEGPRGGVHVLPHWFAAGAPAMPIGNGGPGEPAITLTTTPDRKSLDFHFDHKFTDLLVKSPSSQVDIYILDTFPTQHRVDQPGATKSGKRPKASRENDASTKTGLSAVNWQLSDTDVSGNLKFVGCEASDVPEDVWVPGDPPLEAYRTNTFGDISDHGIFIAGIIQSITRSMGLKNFATLHLVEVLNRNGVGTYFSLAKGLERITQSMHGKNPIVLNMSVLFPTPLEACLYEQCEYKKGEIPEGTLDAALKDAIDLKALLLADIGLKAVLVAAAGNSGKPGNLLPAARYPAAAPSIFGVGALKKNFALADYSNNADDPSAVPQPIWTFGGNYPDPRPAGHVESSVDGPYNLNADYAEGILGISSHSPSGYQYWAGTSFATAIISAAAAVLMAYGYDSSEVWGRLLAACNITLIPGRNILEVTQG